MGRTSMIIWAAAAWGLADRPDRAHDGARRVPRSRRLTNLGARDGPRRELSAYSDPSSLPSSRSSSGTIRVARKDARR